MFLKCFLIVGSEPQNSLYDINQSGEESVLRFVRITISCGQVGMCAAQEEGTGIEVL